jgi:hypothetical protein
MRGTAVSHWARGVFAALALLFALFAEAAEPPSKCSVCGAAPGEKYLTGKDGKVFCSEKCFESTLPVCFLCGKHTDKWSVFEPAGNTYCPVCAALPKCFVCGMPCMGTKLRDGRTVCVDCSKTAVSDTGTAQNLFDDIRMLMASELSIGTNNNIELRLADANELKKHSEKLKRKDAVELGLYLRETTERFTETHSGSSLFGDDFDKDKKIELVKERMTIFALDHMPEAKLAEVFAHELAHDWQSSVYPNITDTKVKEGFAEYVASRVNTLLGRSGMNKRMETNSDPDYGDGYRMVKAAAEEGGLEGLRKWLERFNTKP